jgi:N-acyl-L-homoserine lactone synthetase
MIRYLYADQLSQHPALEDSMFLHRALQFKGRLDWDVTVDDRGWEQDEYDTLNPLYLIWQDEDGRHAGSMRALPTTGRTMVNEHFLDVTGGVRIVSPLIWECTRFCLAPGASPVVAAGLLLGCLEAALRFGVDQAVGVFDARMPRVYGRIGHSPDVIGTSGEGREAVSVGIWTVSEEAREIVSQRSGIPTALMAQWFEASFHAQPSAVRIAA